MVKVPVILAVVKQEIEHGTVSMRRLGRRKKRVIPLHEAVEALAGEVALRNEPTTDTG